MWPMRLPEPSLEESRTRLQEQLGLFHAGVKRFVNPHRYPVGLELGLHERKTAAHPQNARRWELIDHTRGPAALRRGRIAEGLAPVTRGGG